MRAAGASGSLPPTSRTHCRTRYSEAINRRIGRWAAAVQTERIHIESAPRAVTVGSTDRFVVCAASSDVEHLARTTCPGLLWRTAAAVLDGQRQPSSLAEQDALHRPRVSGRPDSRSRSMRSADCEESIAEFDADRYSGSRPARSRPTPPVSGEHGRWVGSRGAECVGRTMPVIRRRRRSRER